MEIKLSDIFKKREIILGIATIMIIIAHLELPYMSDESTVARIFNTATLVSVSLFMLMSGWGCYFSINKNSIFQFFCNRFSRILPIWVVGYLGHYLLWHYALNASWSEYYNCYPIFGYWTQGNISSWFIWVIIVMYIFTPLLNKLLNHSPRLFIIIGIAILLLASQLEFYATDTLYMINSFGVIHIPVYMLGMYLGYQTKLKRDVVIPNILGLIGVFACVIALIWNCIANTQNFGFMIKVINLPWSFAVSWGIAYLFRYTKCQWLSMFSWISLEFYILFEKFAGIFIKCSDSLIKVNICAFGCSLIVGLFLKQLFNIIFRHRYDLK